jgi:hypothetical protein
VPRTRTTKKLAQRIDLNYFKRPTPLKRAKLWLSILLPLLALVWIAERTFTKDSRVYSSGRMSAPHAVLEKECAACHLQQAGAFSAKATDSACLSCHDGPIHHASQVTTPNCANCHSEHRERVNIRAANDQACMVCHANLNAGNPDSKYISGFHSFGDGHPEFEALRKNGFYSGRDLGGIKLNHSIHMKPIRRSPNGPNVQLQCGTCHHPAAVAPDLAYSDPHYRSAKTSYNENAEVRPIPFGTLHPPKPATGRELMAPVRFADVCAGCHLLTFDKRFDFGVPHDDLRVVRAFLLKRFQEYIASHPKELRVVRDPDRNLAGKTNPPEVRILTPSEWVAEKTSSAEELLWGKTCRQCHSVVYVRILGEESLMQSVGKLHPVEKTQPGLKELPQVEPSFTIQEWMPNAKFDHDAHRGFSCVGCHEKTLTSTESSDVLIPGIKNCQTCHAPGPDHAESRCFECHTYHDWSKRKEITPKFTLPELEYGGR